MKLLLTSAVLVLAAANSATAQPATAPFNPLLNVSNTAALRSDLAAISMFDATTYVAWVEENAAGQQIRLRRSNDGAASFIDGTSGRVIVTIDTAETVYTLRLSATAAGVHLLYTSGVEPRLAKARLARSTDGGATFLAPVTLAEGPELGGSPFADLAVDGNGTVHVVLESRDADEDILHLSSTDQGATFSAPAPLAASPGVASTRPRLAARHLQIAAVWEDGDDVGFIYSIDGGATFGTVKNLSATDAASTAPGVAISNAVHVVWTEDNSVAIQTSLDGMAFTATQVIGAAPPGTQLAGVAVGSSANTVHVSWITRDADARMDGPFYRRSTDGAASFAAIQDLRLGGAGRPFGAPAIATFAAARVVWPHSPSGFEEDADVHAAVQPNCGSTWLAPVSGNWTDATKWSPPVVPHGGTVCIMADGAPYTVTIPGGQNASELTIGHATSGHRPVVRVAGGLTIGSSLVNSGELILASQITATAGMVINTERGRLSTAAGAPGAINGSTINYGEVDLAANLAFNGASRTMTNFGPYTIHAGATVVGGAAFVFTQNAGLLKVDGKLEMTAEFSTAGDSMNFNGGEIEGVVIIQGHSWLNIGAGSTGKAIFQFERNVAFGVSSGGFITGAIAPLQTVRLVGITGNNGSARANVPSGLANAGLIELTASAANAANATVVVQAGVLGNTGRIVVRRDDDLSAGRIDGAIENEGVFTIDDDLGFGTNGRLTNRGTITVAAGAALSFGANYIFNQNGGVLSNAGTIEMSAEFSTNGDTFNFNDGIVEGAVIIQGHSRVNIGPGSTGAATFIFERNVAFGFSSGGHLSGDIAAAQTIRVRGTVGGTAQANVAAGFTNFGTLIFESAAPNAGGASMVMAGGTLFNRGTLLASDVMPGKALRGHLENHGAMTVLTPLSLGLAGGTFNNFGNLTVGPNGKITLAPASVVTQRAGTMTLDGPIELATEFSTGPDLFNFIGGDIAGGAGVHLLSTSRLNIAATAADRAGRFVYRVPNGTGGGTISGNIGPQMTLRLQGNAATAANGLSNAGTILLTAEGGNTNPSLNVTAGALINTGTITVEPVGTTAPINAVIQNHGRITINDTIQFNRLNASHLNDGVVEVALTHTLTLTGNSTFRNVAPGGIGGNGTLSIANGSTFIGAGTFGVNISNAGRFRPGASPGIANIAGRYTQMSTGRLEIEIAGNSPGSGFDQVNASDLVTLAGTLEVQIAAGFCIEGSYSFLTYPAVAGDFTTRLGLTGSGSRSLTSSRGATAYGLNTTGPACNNAPVGVADAYGTTAGTALTVSAPGVLGNDNDAQSDSLSAVLVAAPANGTLVLNSDGSFTYVPHAGFTGTDGFTYRASDGISQSGATAVTISVVSQTPPSITALTPDALITGHVRTLTISGTHFSSPRVILQRDDLQVPGTIVFSTPVSIQAQFDVTSAPPGEWTLIVENLDGTRATTQLFVDQAIIFAGFAWEGVQRFPIIPEGRLNRLPNYLTVINVGLTEGMILISLELPHPEMRLKVGSHRATLRRGGTVDFLVWAPRGVKVRVPLFWGLAPEHVNFPGAPIDPAKVTFGERLSFKVRARLGLTAGSGKVTKFLTKTIVDSACDAIKEALPGNEEALEDAAHEATSEARAESERNPGTVTGEALVKKLINKVAGLVPGGNLAAAIAKCEQELLEEFLENWEEEIDRLEEQLYDDPQAINRIREAVAKDPNNTFGGAAAHIAMTRWSMNQNREQPLVHEQQVQGPVGAGFDPNDKAVNSTLFCHASGTGEAARCAPHFIGPEHSGEPIEYVIQFENQAESPGPAANVVVTDVLDDALDPATLEVINTSHPNTEAEPNRFSFDVVGNVLTFRFTGVDLPPNVESPEGEGDVTFRIKPRAGLASGTPIRNSASIVFDFNPPIVTSEVMHVIDTTPPITTAMPSVGPNPHGWNRTDVTVTLQAGDGANGSGVRHLLMRVNGGAEQTVTGGSVTVPFIDEGVHTISYFSVDNVGNVEAEHTLAVRIDKTAPNVSGARVTPSNTYGWNNGPVVVSFTADDALSGVAGEPSVDVTLASEGADQTASAQFVDLAGNAASGAVLGVNIDLTPPTIAATPDRAPNAHGWYGADVVITFTCADTLSGIDTCDTGSYVISEEGLNPTRIGVATDRAGNSAQTSAGTVNIDKTAPVVTCSTTAPVIWPPNHKLIAVDTMVTVSDALSGASGFWLAGVTSNEPDNGLGDGDTANDIQNFTAGTADTSGLLRAERSGRGTGRIYSLVYRGTDLAGNAASCTAAATVPHGQNGGKK